MSCVLLLITACALLVSLAREIVKRDKDSIGIVIWKYFSYYTTLSNVLVLSWFAALTFWPQFLIGNLAQNPNVATSITFYIVTVGIANYLIYGWLNLSLFERVADLLVHAVTPLITFLYWLFFVEKTQLQYSLLGYWLIFPLSYAAYTMCHGKWTQFYPYEFTNVQALGLYKVLLNAFALSISLLIGGALFIFLGKTLGRF
jgi:hypothetical protein